MIKKGSLVRCYLSSGITVTGKVFDLNKSFLQINDSNSKESFLIFNPLQNIIMMSIINDDISINEKNMELPKEENNNQNSKPEINNDISLSDSDKINNLVKLRKDLAKAEKEIISNKLKDHTFNGLPPVKYQSPFIPIKKDK